MEQIPVSDLWMFNYKSGPAPLSGVVRARDAETAYRVAQAWCDRNGYRLPANVRPMILADERILEEERVVKNPGGVEIAADPVGATTGTPVQGRRTQG